MKHIDKIYTKRPFFGVIRITDQLKDESRLVNHKRVYRLMRIMGIEAVGPKPNFSKPDNSHLDYPYLLKDLSITKPNQVWGVDITYVPLLGDWLYLVAIVDWYSRYVLAWELSDTLEVGFCCEALKQALTVGIPDIHNSDKGSHFTSDAYLDILQAHPIRISMDSRGRVFDNIFTERLWRSVKYEEVYLKEYQTPREARLSLTEYFQFYNYERRHQGINKYRPADIYFNN